MIVIALKRRNSSLWFIPSILHANYGMKSLQNLNSYEIKNFKYLWTCYIKITNLETWYHTCIYYFYYLINVWVLYSTSFPLILISYAFVIYSLILWLLLYIFHCMACCKHWVLDFQLRFIIWSFWQGVIIGYKSTHKLSPDNLRLYLTPCIQQSIS